MTLVFQYGSNILTSRLNSQDRLREDATPIDVARTMDNYDLVFDIWSNSNKCAAADILEDRGRRIWGVVYYIPDKLIERSTAGNRKSLDAIEGEGSSYSRVAIDIEYAGTGSRVESVITYIGKSRESGIKTSFNYSRLIICGLREHNISEDYIEYVKTQVVENNPCLEGKIREL